MELLLFKTLWGSTGPLAKSIAHAQANGFCGLEGQAPRTAGERHAFRAELDSAGMDFIAEICTAGSYVPDRNATPEQHLESLRQQAGDALECRPRLITVIAGCDAWSFGASVEFFASALAFAETVPVPVCFETHRSRSLFNPWITRDILNALPRLRLTCDFSHWCCVCERLIDNEPEVLALCAERATHIHARVGYDQGPQVPHPAAPEFRTAVEAHERWWAAIWRAQESRGENVSTMTPEFGPDGYLHCTPFTGQPVADLDEINAWMARREKEQFKRLSNLSGKDAVHSER